MSTEPEHICTIMQRLFEPRRCLDCGEPFAWQFQMQQYCEPCRHKAWTKAEPQVYKWRSQMGKQVKKQA